MILDYAIVDFETFFDKDFTLKKLSYSEYVRDKRFLVLSVSVCGSATGMVTKHAVGESEVRVLLETIDWTKTRFVAHNALFDALIMTEHFGIKPKEYACTLFASRVLLQGRPKGHSLDEICTFFAMETKPDVLSKMKGLREIPQSMRAMVEEYNNHDVDSTHTLYKKFWGLLPDRERKLIDLTLRMFVEAKLEVNLELAEIARVEAEQEMAAAIALAGMTEKQLGSNPIVATKLESYGVEVPTKISKKTGKRTFAFAKSDEDFQDLLTHEDERVRNLANARLQVKSTLIRTRASRLILAGSTGKLPVGYGLAAAHTMRFGGANRMNMQNFPRGSTLRRAIRAPEGYVLVVADSGQIEARKAAWFAGARQILDAFATGVDIYAREASSTFGFEVIKTEHPVERFCGKVLVLGLGFGMGPPKYQGTLASGQMGMKVNLPLETCKTAVYGWRTRNHQIPTSWKDFDAALGFMSLGAGVMEYRNNIRFDAANGMIWYPNGSFRMYPDMHIDDDGNYCYRRGKVYHRLWGGTLMEHFSQGSSRDLIVEKMLIIDARWPVVMMSHDEIIALVPEDEADEALEYMLDEMSTPAEWCQDLPLSAEGGFSREYSK